MKKNILFNRNIPVLRHEEKVSNEQHHSPLAFFESVNHPRPRFLSYSVKPIFLALLAGLFALTGCEENKSTAPDPKTLSFDVSGVVAEGALIKGASVSLYLSGADSSLDSTTSDNQGRYSFTLEEDIRARVPLSLRLVATYMKAGEMTTFRSYVDLRGMNLIPKSGIDCQYQRDHRICLHSSFRPDRDR